MKKAKFVVAIDWKAKVNDGFSFVELKAKNLKDALIESQVAVRAYIYSGVFDFSKSTDDIYCLRLLMNSSNFLEGTLFDLGLICHDYWAKIDDGSFFNVNEIVPQTAINEKVREHYYGSLPVAI